jgi:hypothetical protein
MQPIIKNESQKEPRKPSAGAQYQRRAMKLGTVNDAIGWLKLDM